MYNVQSGMLGHFSCAGRYHRSQRPNDYRNQAVFAVTLSQARRYTSSLLAVKPLAIACALVRTTDLEAYAVPVKHALSNVTTGGEMPVVVEVQTTIIVLPIVTAQIWTLEQHHGVREAFCSRPTMS